MEVQPWMLWSFYVAIGSWLAVGLVQFLPAGRAGNVVAIAVGALAGLSTLIAAPLILLLAVSRYLL